MLLGSVSVLGGPWSVPGGVLDGLWGILGFSGALLGVFGGPRGDPWSVFKRSRQVWKSLKNHWLFYDFQQWGRPGGPLEVPGGAWVVLRGPLGRVRRPKQRPGRARQSHRQPRGSPRGRRGGRQGIRGRPRGGLGVAVVNGALPAVLGALLFVLVGPVWRSRRRPAEG